MRKIILASNNQHKIKEFKEIITDAEILSLQDIGYLDDIIEDGDTFLENALIKCRAVKDFLDEKGEKANIIADDSGLCVNALDGAPGIFSARYAGGHGNDIANRSKLLKELEGKSDRSAYFTCFVAEMFEDGSYIYSEGRTYGAIMNEEIGDKSFGYDCLFMSNDLHKSFGEASDEEKNSVSHRGRAIIGLLEEENKRKNQN